jgi:L-alanine-DL-glutamate epimerase-like enolase superfamily enzyme
VNIKLYPYQLEFIFPFRIAHGIRTHTDAVFVELELDGVIAYGEATLPPYLLYTQASTMACLSRLDISNVSETYKTNELLPSLGIMPSTMEAPALAAIDMALWTLEAKLKKTTIRELLGIHEPDNAVRTYTISVCDKGEMVERITYGKECGFNTFKLKLDGIDDHRMLKDFRSLTDAPFAVDANQSWIDPERSMVFAKELKKQGCLLIEQPFAKDDLTQTKRLSDVVGIPIIADEACQNLADIERVKDSYNGINIKLQKCGGITPAVEMIRYAKSIGLKVLIGCMSESAIGCDAAEVLSPLCDWNDLDGKYLVKQVRMEDL